MRSGCSLFQKTLNSPASLPKLLQLPGFLLFCSLCSLFALMLDRLSLLLAAFCMSSAIMFVSLEKAWKKQNEKPEVLFLKLKEKMGVRERAELWAKIRRWVLRSECKREKFGPNKVITSLFVGSHCLYPRVTKMWILHQLFKILPERITMHTEFLYRVPTCFNPALAKDDNSYCWGEFKTTFRADFSILVEMLCVLECRLVSWEGRFFPLQCWWLGCQVSAAPDRHMSNEVQGVGSQLYSEIPLAGIPAQHSDGVWEKDECCAWNVGMLL